MNLSCLLCGIAGPQIRIDLVEWIEPSPTKYSTIPRCTNRAECRARVEATGEAWPLNDQENKLTRVSA